VARAPRGHWPWWTVLLLGLPVLALSGLIFLFSLVAWATACMDTCIPAAQARASTVGTVDSIVFYAIGFAGFVTLHP